MKLFRLVICVAFWLPAGQILANPPTTGPSTRSVSSDGSVKELPSIQVRAGNQQLGKGLCPSCKRRIPRWRKRWTYHSPTRRSDHTSISAWFWKGSHHRRIRQRRLRSFKWSHYHRNFRKIRLDRTRFEKWHRDQQSIDDHPGRVHTLALYSAII